MIIKFTPVEGDTREYQFKPKKLMSPEAEAIERIVGKPYAEAVQAVMQGSALARRALVYTLEKRAHPTLKWPDFVFPFDAVEVEFDAEELAEIRAGVESAPGLSDEERAEALADLAALEESAPEAPKASEPSGDPSI